MFSCVYSKSFRYSFFYRATLEAAFEVSLLDFIITKYLKEEVNDNLKVYVDECSPCGPPYNWRYKDLSMSRDWKVMMFLPQMEKCPMDFYQGIVFTNQTW